MIQCEKYFSCKNPIALQYKNDLIENFKFDLHYMYFIFVHVPGSKQWFLAVYSQLILINLKVVFSSRFSPVG